MNNLIETIRKEIERKRDTAEGKQGEYYLGQAVAFSQVLELLDTLQEPAKRGYNECNGCEYCRTLKDQIGWQFRGCFGGDYKGKPIAEIEFCPLKLDILQEQEPKGIALTWEDICNLEEIINQVHYENPNGIGAESFGEEVLRRFNESKK